MMNRESSPLSLETSFEIVMYDWVLPSTSGGVVSLTGAPSLLDSYMALVELGATLR